jgi:hypothetical protein
MSDGQPRSLHSPNYALDKQRVAGSAFLSITARLLGYSIKGLKI